MQRRADSESGDVFVVTDGEVSSWEAVVAAAKRSGRRVFTVGVGSAVSEAFVRRLAEATGGECELVSPREGMADRVIRHFERMRAPRAKRVTIHWPEGARDLAPTTFGAVFEGDTVTASAQFDRPAITGHVTLEIETDGGDVFRQQLAMTPPARISGPSVNGGAARRIGTAEGIGSCRGTRSGASLSTREPVDQLARRGREAGRREGVRHSRAAQGAADAGCGLGRRGSVGVRA